MKKKLIFGKIKKKTNNKIKKKNKKKIKKIKLKSSQTIKTLEKIQIQESSSIQSDEQKVYGIYEPANYDFNLNMWSTTKAEDLRSSLKRLNKIELSKSSNEILEMQFYFHFHIHQKE